VNAVDRTGHATENVKRNEQSDSSRQSAGSSMETSTSSAPETIKRLAALYNDTLWKL
jgi:hypothetical protein